MISIVICSRASKIPIALEANIQSTIGLPLEIIAIDNSQNQYSLFEAYQKGVGLAQYEIICFMHDDILLHTMDWGQKVKAHFMDRTVGAVGVAGGAYYAKLPGAWWSHGLIAQHIFNPPQDIQYQTKNTLASPVVVLDGVFICIRKALFTEKQLQFDTKRFTGFHLYDVDISLQVFHAGYTLLSVTDIDITHFAKSVLNPKWMENVLILQDKWEHQLPSTVLKTDYEQEIRAEYACLEEFAKTMRKNGQTRLNTILFSLRQILKYRLIRFKIGFPLYFIKYASRYLLKRMGVR